MKRFTTPALAGRQACEKFRLRNVPPSADDCAQLRELAGLTLAQMADLVHLSDRGDWSRYEGGRRRCDLARWELALIKTGHHPALRVTAR